jgi:anti-sigma regulatory factor (Ser/Thr protein kinase)
MPQRQELRGAAGGLAAAYGKQLRKMSQVDVDRPRRGTVSATYPAEPAASSGTTTVSLEGEKPSCRARRAVIKVLTGLGVCAERRDEAEVAITELVVNAERHAPGPRELRIIATPDRVTFAVADGGGDHAMIARILADPGAGVEWFEEHGRGLLIVAALFPGACGARVCPDPPPRAATPARPAKEVWISVTLS